MNRQAQVNLSLDAAQGSFIELELQQRYFASWSSRDRWFQLATCSQPGQASTTNILPKGELAWLLNAKMTEPWSAKFSASLQGVDAESVELVLLAVEASETGTRITLERTRDIVATRMDLSYESILGERISGVLMLRQEVDLFGGVVLITQVRDENDWWFLAGSAFGRLETTTVHLRTPATVPGRHRLRWLITTLMDQPLQDGAFKVSATWTPS